MPVNPACLFVTQETATAPREFPANREKYRESASSGTKITARSIYMALIPRDLFDVASLQRTGKFSEISGNPIPRFGRISHSLFRRLLLSRVQRCEAEFSLFNPARWTSRAGQRLSFLDLLLVDARKSPTVCVNTPVLLPAQYVVIPNASTEAEIYS